MANNNTVALTGNLKLGSFICYRCSAFMS